VRSRVLRYTTGGVLLALVAACATGRAVRSGQSAANRGDWDSAVAFYRQALGTDPTRVDVKIALQRAMTAASAEHIKRARDLEAQDQLAGAIAEYRLASEMDPTNTLAVAKANELERRQRDRTEAARPPSQLDQLRAQARQSSTIPTIDPRIKISELRFNNASVRDVLSNIAAFSNPPINITYATGTEALTGRPYSIDVRDLSLEEALNQVLSNNQLAFKVVNPRTILVFSDTAPEHAKYDDLYSQVFYLSNVEPTDAMTIINQMTTGPGTNRPVCAPSKSTSAITCRATGPVMGVIEKIIHANDKPKAEVLIDIEILEVDRTRVKQLGLDLTQYAFGLTFSPEVAPPNTSGTIPGANPPPFNLNTISGGVSANDVYVTVPTAMVRLLESDNRTRTLAKPSVRGAEGAPITMNLGDQIPVLNSTIPSVTTGLGTTAPVVNYTYKPVGVNLTVTPRVTFDDEIILDLIVDNSGVGATINVGGTNVQSFTGRTVHTVLRLRDGESNLLAGLLREQSATLNTGLAGLARIPILRNIFGNVNQTVESSDVVIIVTPHIVRSHELTTDDLKPMFIGTLQNLGTGTPSLISPETPIPSGVTPPGGAASATPPGAGAPGVAGPAGAPPAAAGAPPRVPGVVPIEPVGGAQPPAVPPQPPALIALFSPGTEFQSGVSTPYTVPITVSNLPEVQTISLRVSYNATSLRAQAAVQGVFMSQGNLATTFVPRIDANAGTVDLVFSRPNTTSTTAWNGSGLLGSIQFLAMSPGSAQINLSGSATGRDGQPVTVQFGSVTVVVK
jgi:general secretion pathway protein D